MLRPPRRPPPPLARRPPRSVLLKFFSNLVVACDSNVGGGGGAFNFVRCRVSHQYLPCPWVPLMLYNACNRSKPNRPKNIFKKRTAAIHNSQPKVLLRVFSESEARKQSRQRFYLIWLLKGKNRSRWSDLVLRPLPDLKGILLRGIFDA